MDVPSFLKSTLSIAFIICVGAVVAMIFYGIKPDPVLFSVLTGVIGAYMSARGMSAGIKVPAGSNPVPSSPAAPDQST